MKNNASIKSENIDSPKTPGGISKSLLTPCRRVGLSRNWKKGGPSPFVSPVVGGSGTPSRVAVEDAVEKKPSRKRKEPEVSAEIDEVTKCSPVASTSHNVLVNEKKSTDTEPNTDNNDGIYSTPTRHIEVPRKKKSKTLLTALKKNIQQKVLSVDINTIIENSSDGAKEEDNKQKNEGSVPSIQKSKSKDKNSTSPTIKKSKENLAIECLDKAENSDPIPEQAHNIVIPLQKSSSKGKKILVPKNSFQTLGNQAENNLNEGIKVKHCTNSPNIPNKGTENIEKETKPRSPNELTKECIVVIQKKIFKSNKIKLDAKSEELNDSESDDVPLGQLNKKSVVIPEADLQSQEKRVEIPTVPKVQEVINLVDDEEDFVEIKKVKIKKLEDKSTSIGGLKKRPKNKPKTIQKPLQQTQNTDFDDEDDFDFDNKKTILIRKSYEKTVKPQKAKSTGSITQRDIDELKARIETKKKILLARSMTEDTEELRTLIKKWQKGCQDALMELMDLMKTKFPDRQNMDYSEMLSMLNIPTNLVGYDEENDCFCTPDDASIVLSTFK